ncbi:MAG: hypothetical protein HYR55_01390 [Acidobacteria bacterium]|nr:hypothetical protein [Acidobacteriota bacterium]MBI3656021.1 hypothetical protein [Acidobacteriota bacterium]
MSFVAKGRQRFSSEWLFSARGGYFVGLVSVAVLITSAILFFSARTYHLDFIADPKVENHMAECEGCRNRAIGVIWNHIPSTADRASLIQDHLNQCAVCQQKILTQVHEHVQLLSALGNKSRIGVPSPGKSK